VDFSECRAWDDVSVHDFSIEATGRFNRISGLMTAIGRFCCKSHAGSDNALHGWGERTRTRKCRFTKRQAELLGFPEHFCTRDFSRFRRRFALSAIITMQRLSAPTGLTFASSSPLSPATESGLCGRLATGQKMRKRRGLQRKELALSFVGSRRCIKSNNRLSVMSCKSADPT
jgi:hypothetical protein